MVMVVVVVVRGQQVQSEGRLMLERLLFGFCLRKSCEPAKVNDQASKR